MPIQMVSGVGQAITRGTIVQSNPRAEIEQGANEIARSVGDVLSSSCSRDHRPTSYTDRSTGGQIQSSGSILERLGLAIGIAMGRYEVSAAIGDAHRADPEVEGDLVPTAEAALADSEVEVPDAWRGNGKTVDVKGQ